MKMRLFKLINGAVLFFFMGSTLLSAAPADSTLSPNPIPARSLEELGSPIETYEGRPDQPTVYYIQDAHSILSAQRAIQGLIDVLQKNHSVPLVVLEGASGPLDMDLLRSYPDRAKLEKVLWSFSAKGVISGAEVQAAIGPQALFHGIEDAELYKKSLREFREAQLEFSKDQSSLEAAGNSLIQLEEKFFAPELHQLSALHRSFGKDELSLSAFLDRLKPFGLSADGRYPSLSKMVGFLQKEDRLEKDRELYQKIQNWVKREFKDSPEMNRIKQAFETGRATLGDTVRALRDLEPRVLTGPEKDLLQNIASREAIENISGTDLMEELHQWVSSREEQFAQGDRKAREILEEIRRFELLKKFLALGITSSEWEEVQRTSSVLRAESFQDFFERSGAKVACSWDINPASRFYRSAAERDEILFKNFERLASQNTIADDSIILVTGGFHSQGITQKLREKGFSYQVLQPRFHPGGENPYLEVMMKEANESGAPPVSALAPKVGDPAVQKAIAEALLPAPSEESYVSSLGAWLNDLSADWAAGRTRPDIQGSLAVLDQLARAARSESTGASLGKTENGRKKETMIFSTPDVLNTKNVLNDIFNFTYTALTDPSLNFGRVIVFELDQNQKNIQGRVGLETYVLEESGVHKIGAKAGSTREELEDAFDSWRARGQEENLSKIEKMAKDMRFFLATDSGPVSMAVKERTVKHVKVDEGLSDPISWALNAVSLAVPKEYYLIPIIHEDKVLGVVYVDSLTPEGDAQMIDPGRLKRLEAFVQSLAKSINSSKDFEQLHWEIAHDRLTGVLSRSGLEDGALDFLVKAARDEKTVVLYKTDLVDFKTFNDHGGDPAGDDYLKQYFQIMWNSFRDKLFDPNRKEKPTGVVGRPGGDEAIGVFLGEDMEFAYKRLTEIALPKVRGIDLNEIIQRVRPGLRLPPGANPTFIGGVSVIKGYEILQGKYGALIPFYHHDNANAMAGKIREDIQGKIERGEPVLLGWQVIETDKGSRSYFLYDKSPEGLPFLRDRIQNGAVYQSIYKEADDARDDVKRNGGDPIRPYSEELRRKLLAQKNQLDALRDVRNRLLQVFQKLPIPAHWLDMDGKIYDANDSWLALLGYKRKEVEGRPIFDFLPPEDRDQARASHFRRTEQLERIPKGVQPAPEGYYNIHLTRDYLHKDGSRVTVSSKHAVIKDMTGKIDGVITYLTDARWDKYKGDRAEDAGVLNQVGLDKSGIIKHVTKGLFLRMGYENSDPLIGQSISSFFDAEDNAKVQAFMADQRLQKIEGVRLKTGSGGSLRVILVKAFNDPLKQPYYDFATTFTVVPIGAEVSGKSLGREQGELTDAQGYLGSLGAILNVRGILVETVALGEDERAASFFALAGASKPEYDREAVKYLESKKVDPFFFNATLPKESSFLVLDLDSLAQDPAALTRMTELVGENGKILPFFTTKTTGETQARFKREVSALTKQYPDLGAKILKTEKLSNKKLSAAEVDDLKTKSGLADASLGMIVSDPDVLTGDFAATVPAGKEAIAFQFKAGVNHPTLSKAVYSMAFSAFLNGSKGLGLLNESFVKMDQRSGIPIFSFDLVQFAAALTAEWSAQTAILSAA